MVVEDDCAAFVSNVDIAALFDAMQASTPLTRTMLTESAIVLFRSSVNTYRAYMTDTLHLPELVQSGALKQALSPSSLSVQTN